MGGGVTALHLRPGAVYVSPRGLRCQYRLSRNGGEHSAAGRFTFWYVDGVLAAKGEGFTMSRENLALMREAARAQ